MPWGLSHAKGRRKGFVDGLEVEDSPDWVTAAESMDKCHLGVEQEEKELAKSWQHGDIRQPDLRRKQDSCCSDEPGDKKAATAGMTASATACEECKIKMGRESDPLCP